MVINGSGESASKLPSRGFTAAGTLGGEGGHEARSGFELSLGLPLETEPVLPRIIRYLVSPVCLGHVRSWHRHGIPQVGI